MTQSEESWTVGMEIATNEEEFLDAAHRLIRAGDYLDRALLVVDFAPDPSDVVFLNRKGITVLELGVPCRELPTGHTPTAPTQRLRAAIK